MTAFPLADDRLRREKAANPAFARFLEVRLEGQPSMEASAPPFLTDLRAALP